VWGKFTLGVVAHAAKRSRFRHTTVIGIIRALHWELDIHILDLPSDTMVASSSDLLEAELLSFLGFAIFSGRDILLYTRPYITMDVGFMRSPLSLSTLHLQVYPYGLSLYRIRPTRDHGAIPVAMLVTHPPICGLHEAFIIAVVEV
jgi:hypothetical protein